jgi:hypothetical protein
MVSTQDVGFGTLWTKLLGEDARWEAGEDDVPALTVVPGDPLRVGMGLVSVWVASAGPVLVCNPQKGVRVLKDLRAPAQADDVRRALRDAGAVVHEHDGRQRESAV